MNTTFGVLTSIILFICAIIVFIKVQALSFSGWSFTGSDIAIGLIQNLHVFFGCLAVGVLIISAAEKLK